VEIDMHAHIQDPAQEKELGKRRPNQQLLPTLFDRLFDNAPHKLKESELEYAVDKKQMMNIVRRDLAFLFNTGTVSYQLWYSAIGWGTYGK
jgi:type VI secretion system protein ImpF